jgi:two-component system chemotaxis response regulator CheB
VSRLVAPNTRQGVSRVLVVDDSAVARRSISRAIAAFEGLELAGVAENGQVALDRLAMLRPDVMVLDLEMPVMDGFKTLSALRVSHPDLPVVVFSSRTSRGAQQTLEALSLGASDFALKPSGIDGMSGDSLSEELLPLLKALSAKPGPIPVAATAPGSMAKKPRKSWSPHKVSVVVVAVSTGGPAALAIVLESLPADLPVPVLIVQHMPKLFTGFLAERLDGMCRIKVQEAEQGMTVLPGNVYIAPGGRHMEAKNSGTDVQIALSDGPQENSCRPAADVLFRSAVRVYRAGVLGVVLTGMGQDGFRGAQGITDAGGAVIIQDPRTAVVDSMPQAVAKAGLADATLGLNEIATEIMQRSGKQIL